MKMTIKTGDNVLVITGKDKGKSGKVTAVNADANKVVVEDINVVTKHQKPRSQQDKGGIFKRPAPIDASNVLVICPVCGKATRIAHAEIDGKKVRVCKKCNASVDKEFVKQTKKEAKKTIKASELKNAKLKAAPKAEEKVEKPAGEKKTTAKKTTTTKKTTAKAETGVEKKTSTTKKAASTTAKKTTATAEKKTTTTKKSTAKKETK